MSSSYTYQLPEEKKFLKAVVEYLIERKNKIYMVSLLEGSKIEFIKKYRNSSNKIVCEVVFHVPTHAKILELEPYKRDIESACNDSFQRNSGYEVSFVEFSKASDDGANSPSLQDNIEELVANKQNIRLLFNLPEDVVEKGKEMGDVYVYLYVIENALRVFIEKVLIDNYGPNYFENLPTGAKRNIEKNKNNYAKQKWLPVREGDIYYTDFSQLGEIIKTMWNIFGKFFKDEHWIKVQIDEISEIRNFIAHNSYIDDFHKNIVKTNFEKICKQLDITT